MALVDLEQLTAEVRQAKQEQAQELEEIEALITQTSAEIDRLLPEKNDISRRLREMEGSIEQVSRTDLRRMYAIAQEASMRLYMMQGRLEQLQYKQKVLQRSALVFDQLLATASQVATVEPEPTAPTVLSGPEIARAVMAAREAERHQLAQQLHNFTAQLLAGLVLRAQICERAVEVDQARAREELRQLREALAERLQATRLLIFELQPQVLDDLGLVPTLRRYIQLVERLGANGRGHSDQAPSGEATSATPTIDLAVLGAERRYSHAVEIGSFRVVQEALRNALQHAQPNRIVVTVDDRGDHLAVTVADDGSGFDADAAMATARQKQIGGLANLIAEADALEASLTVESEPGNGSRISLNVPL